jgi:hypothetical protein
MEYKITTFQRWSKIFKFVRSECISLKNTALVLEFSLTIPGTSAAIERVSSSINSLWTDEKSCFLVETIKAVLGTKTHFEDLSFIYEVQAVCPKGNNNCSNINRKLTSNKIL